MSHTVTVNNLVAYIRQEADIETGDQANSHFPDSLLERWIDRAYRKLFDVVVESAGLELFAATTTLTAPLFAVPATVYRVLGIDQNDGGSVVSLEPWNFPERNGWDLAVDVRPRWRVMGGQIEWKPAAPTTNVTLRYIPTPSALAAGGSFDAVNGWDDFMVLWVVRKIRARQSLDFTDVALQLRDARRDVGRAAARLRVPSTISDTRTESDEAYYNG